ncbi:hypothetical protein GJAV_G00242750 [Gymnothorax javanicus]|nr:hypothetical protein GJAV_G00242750 [Gymnothorax javanicus]
MTEDVLGRLQAENNRTEAMGIQGLLQFIKDASEAINVKKYKGQTVAVDTYCWLHKGAFSCAEKLAKGEATDQYVMYCMKFVDMLLTFGVKPILVFDGCNLPSKKEVETARRERRQANLQKGKQLLREGKISEARDCFTRSINVTPAMAREVIKAARTRGVDCVVAPYEADAQLAFLNKSGIAQAVITEDSDLLAFGCKKVILKMDKHGNGLEVHQSNLGRCRALGDVFTEEKFRYMCILSGCDYLPSLYGIGLGKACKLLRLASNPDILKVIRKMGQYLKMNVTVSDEYIEGFVKANNTFLYQLVFDPVHRKVVPLNPYPSDIDPTSLSYAGRNIGDEKGLQMALGNLDINTMQKIDNFNPDDRSAVDPICPRLQQPARPPRSRGWNDSKENCSPPNASIWRKAYTPGGPPAPAPKSPQRPCTKGKERVVCVPGLRLPHREIPVKRPREDADTSEEDILAQYSSAAAALKKPRREESVRVSSAERPPVTASQPRPRNRFATLLQRRSQDEESGDEQGIRSRFFCSVASGPVVTPEPEGSGAEGSLEPAPLDDRLQAVEGAEAGSPVESEGEREERTPSPSSSQFPQPAGRGRGVFCWPSSSGGGGRAETPGQASGLAALQRFQRQKEAFSWSSPCPRESPPPVPSPPCPEQEDDTPLDSPPSQDSAYFSQPSRRSSPGGEETPPPSHYMDSTPELNTSQESSCSDGISCSPVLERKPAALKAKASGLQRGRSGDLGKRGKIQPSAPARASGLRKNPAGSGKKSSPNNENAPGLQATISSLWKNFGFQKERPKMNSGNKGEPMSPVKDNIPPLTPESSKDVYLASENASCQKVICL